jgi:hypothetical protein
MGDFFTRCESALRGFEDRLLQFLIDRLPATAPPAALPPVRFSITEGQHRALQAVLGIATCSAVCFSVYITYQRLLAATDSDDKGDAGKGPDAALQLTSIEKEIYRSCKVQRPGDDKGGSGGGGATAFSCVGGLETAVARLVEQAVLPLSQPALLHHSKLLQAPSGVLLYGPPGTGKTLLASRLAVSTRATFLSLSPATLQNMYVGQSARLTAAAFSLARKLAPCILFFDEVDGLLPRRDLSMMHAHQQEFITNFLSCWEGLGVQLGGTEENKWVLVVAATNRPQAIDTAALRRLPCQLEVPMPDAGARESILAALLAGERCEEGLQLRGTAEQAVGFSGSDLRELVKTAALFPVREAIEEGGAVRGLTDVDLFLAMQTVRPTGEVAKRYRTAS